MSPNVAARALNLHQEHHPTQQGPLLKRPEAAGAQVWRPDECGDVEVVTDCESLGTLERHASLAYNRVILDAIQFWKRMDHRIAYADKTRYLG